MDAPMIWFAAVTVLWTGYFVLEGFDFGVGVLAGPLSRDDAERGRLLSTILPVWDGNEVWLITAIGAMFAAFPAWYAGVLSGFYPLFLVAVLALIVRAVGLEYRGKRDDAPWRRACDAAVTTGSVAAALAWGMILSGLAYGVPTRADGNVTATLADLVHPYTIAGAVTVALLFASHGAAFLTLKTEGRLRTRARRAALVLTPVTAAATITFAIWTHVTGHTTVSTVAAVVLALAPIAAVVALLRHRDGWAFVGTTVAAGAYVVTLFSAMPPYAIPSADGGVLIADAAASPYTLTIMTIAAVVFLPLILAYQAWTYWVFRRRVLSPPS